MKLKNKWIIIEYKITKGKIWNTIESCFRTIYVKNKESYCLRDPEVEDGSKI